MFSVTSKPEGISVQMKASDSCSVHLQLFPKVREKCVFKRTSGRIVS